jgi:Acyl-CoA dehydrogenase, N-terminal domain
MATPVQKPDYTGRRTGFIFTDEHDALRDSMTSWVVKELAPYADEWEETQFPDSVFRRAGELGFLGLCLPEEYGGQGGDYYYSLVRAEALTHANSGGLSLGVSVHTDMVMPPLKEFGTEDQRQRYLVPRDFRTRCGIRRGGDPDTRRAIGRRLGHQRVEDVHNQRSPCGLHSARCENATGRAPQGNVAVFG